MEPQVGSEGKYWIESLNRGDPQAISYFFDLHYKSLCFFADRLIHNEDEAEDIVARCFVLLWERSANFTTGDHIKAFLYKTCWNDCMNFIRDSKRKVAHQEIYAGQISEKEEYILQGIIRTEFLQILSQEIELLPERPRDVFKLIYFEGKKLDEIAFELNLSIQTVRNHKTRAVDLLKTSFLKKGISGPLMAAFVLFLTGDYK